MTLDEYERLKRTAEETQRDADRAAGAVEQLRKQLADLGCKSVKEAKRRRDAFSKEIEALEVEADTAMKELESEYGDRI